MACRGNQPRIGGCGVTFDRKVLRVVTSQERRHYMFLLKKAKQGDELACEQLTKGLARAYGYMIRNFHSVDPAFDNEDLMVQFQMGIWQHIQKVDDRGDPLWHLAWRGQRSVCSLLNVIKQRRHGTKEYIARHGERSIGTIPDGFDLVDDRPETEPEFAMARAQEKELAERQVARLLAHEDLSDRQRQLVATIGIVATHGEADINARTAKAMGISAQAAGILHKRVLTKLTGADQETAAEFPCGICGRYFRSKGALTQHKRGQSGHKPCEAAVN